MSEQNKPRRYFRQHVICIQCGKDFSSYNIDPKYCSRACKAIGTTAKIDHPAVAEMYRSGMTIDEIAVVVGYGPKAVTNSLRRSGVAMRKTAKRNQTGENNSSWKGGVVIHQAGYKMVLRKDHPRAASNSGYVFEHILVVEKHIGRLLVWLGAGHPDTEIVHHRNGNKTDNRIENLEITTYCEHVYLHLNDVGRRRFTREDISAILRRCHSGETRRSVAMSLGVCESHISAIVLGKLYRDVPREEGA